MVFRKISTIFQRNITGGAKARYHDDLCFGYFSDIRDKVNAISIGRCYRERSTMVYSSGDIHQHPKDCLYSDSNFLSERIDQYKTHLT
jgi:hypothetical protein